MRLSLRPAYVFYQPIYGLLLIVLATLPFDCSSANEVAQHSTNESYRFASDAKALTSTEADSMASHSQSIRQQVNQLLADIQQGRSMTGALVQMTEDTHRTALEKDLTVHGLAMALRQLQPNQVNADLISWLQQYQHRVWRYHDESSYYRIPVVNVAAAIAGTQNEWRYYAGLDAAVQLASHTADIQAVVQQYFQSSAPYQRGFEKQLNSYDEKTLVALYSALSARAELASSRLNGYVALALFTHTAADATPFIQWIQNANPTAVPELLRHAVTVLGQHSYLSVCEQALTHADPSVFSVAISLAKPHWQKANDDKQKQVWQQFLFNTLSDPKHGSAAAHQLIRVATPEQLTQRLKHTQNSLEKQRLVFISEMQKGQ